MNATAGLFVFSALVLLGCDSEKKAPSSPQPASPKTSPGTDNSRASAPQIEGQWYIKCAAQKDADGNVELRKSETMMIDAKKITITGTTYASDDQKCSRSEQEIILVSSYKLGAASTNLKGAYDIDLAVESMDLKFKSQKLVDDSNAAVLCGRKDWKLGVAVDILNDPCFGDTASRQAKSVVFLSGNKLQFGLEKTGSTNERPTELDPEQLYVK